MIKFETKFMDRFNRLVDATERQAKAAEELNKLLGTPSDDNTVDPKQVEALQSQLDASSTALKDAVDHAANT